MASGGKQVSPAVAVIVIIIVLAIIVAVYYWAAHKKPAPAGNMPMMKGPMGNMMKGPMGNMPPGAKGPMGPGGMKVPVAPPSEGAPETAPSGE